MNEVVLRMQYSGYNKKLRNEVVDSALKAYRAKEEAEQEGERPMYRSKNWRKDEREQVMAKKQKSGIRKNKINQSME